MKNIKPLPLIVLIFAMLLQFGCQKSHCYYCYHYQGDFFAIKNSDTIHAFVQINTEFQDSINFYITRGYHIDTLTNGYFPDPPNGISVCDNEYNNIRYSGNNDSCNKIK